MNYIFGYGRVLVYRGITSVNKKPVLILCKSKKPHPLGITEPATNKNMTLWQYLFAPRLIFDNVEGLAAFVLSLGWVGEELHKLHASANPSKNVEPVSIDCAENDETG